MAYLWTDIKGYFFVTSTLTNINIKKIIKDIAKKHLYNDQHSISDVIQKYQKINDRYLFAFFCVKNNGEQWICVKLEKQEGRSVFSTIKDGVSIDSFSKFNVIEFVKNLLKSYFNVESIIIDQTKSLTEALNKIFAPFYETECDERNFSSPAQMFNNEIVQLGLQEPKSARSKQTLERILSSLESLLELSRPIKFILDQEHFLNLCKKLNSTNFQPKEEEKVDLRIKTMKLIVQLIENDQDMRPVKDEFENERGFLITGKKIFLKKILELNDQLREDPRNVTIKTSLKLAINDRIEYLSNKNKLVPDLVKPQELLELFRHFVLEENIQSLKNEKKHLERSCIEDWRRKAALEDISDDRDDETSKIDFKRNSLLNASIENNIKFQEIHHQLEYLEIKLSIRDEINFQELIPILALKNLNNLILPPKFLLKLFVIGKKLLCATTVTNVINILFTLPTSFYEDSEPNNFPEEFYQYLTLDSTKQLILVTKSGIFGGKYSVTHTEFLAKILIESDNDELRRNACEALAYCRNLPHEITSILEIERLIQRMTIREGKYNDAVKLFKAMYNHVTQNYRLTWNSFKTLEQMDIGEEKLSIIETIIEKDLQILPDFLVVSTKREINVILGQTTNQLIRLVVTSNDLIGIALTLCESLIVGNYMKMTDLKERAFLKCLQDDKYQTNALLLVLTAARLDETISDCIVREIHNIKHKTSLVMNCMRALAKTESSLDILKNSKKSVRERQAAIMEIVADKAFHNDSTIQIMINLVRFEKDLRDDIFVALLQIVTHETWCHCSEIFSEVIQAIQTPCSKIPLEAIEEFYKRRILENDEILIKYLLYRAITDDTDVQNKCCLILKRIFNGKNVSNGYAHTLIRIMCLSRSTNVKLNILNMIETTENQLKTTISTYKTIIQLRQDTVDDQILSKLLVVLQHPFFVPRSIIESIIQSLPHKDPMYLTLASDCLRFIHSRQKLEPATFELFLQIIKKDLSILDNFNILQFLLIGMNVKILIDVMSCERIVSYYQQLKDKLGLQETKLDGFFKNSVNVEQLRVLNSLTIAAVSGYQLNTRIFVHQNEHEWQKTILSSILIQSVLVTSSQLNESAVDDFLSAVMQLEKWLKSSTSEFEIEQVLECLIDHKWSNLEDLSNIFLLLQDEDALQIFFQKENITVDMRVSKIRENLLKKMLPTFPSEQLKTLNEQLFKYKTSTIQKLIGSPFDFDSLDQLTNFFWRVSSDLATNRREAILNDISLIRNIQGWNAALSIEIIEHLMQFRHISLNVDMTSFKQKLSRVLDSGWSVRSIEIILDRCNNLKDAGSILSAFDVIYEYEMKEYDTDIRGNALYEIISTTPVTSWNKIFHKIAIFQKFPGTYQKSPEQLIEEIAELNSQYNIEYLKDCERIQQDYTKVMVAYHSKSLILTENSSTISKWSKDLIKKWSMQYNAYEDHQYVMYESVAVTMRAIEILNDFLPRDIQILSLLCLLNPEADKGRLTKINTGEGKTTIIAMLAVIKALQGHTVDIITSSGELAKPQSIEMTLFYSLFDLSVAHNGDDPKDIKERYKADILYGAADAFQGDILRDEYSKLRTRNGRKCDLAIVDEVDSMLIDGKNHIVMLSSVMPAMNYLETILAAIYIHISTIANLIKEENGKTFFVKENNRINDDGSITKDVEDELIELTVTKKEFIERNTELHIRKALRDNDGLKIFSEEEQIISEDYVQLSIPKHLYELVTRTQLKKWIDSAIYAMFKCDLNKHYILTEDGKVAPVDAINTGVIQQNMHWNNGLHQFLQIKHGAKITPENMTTNFISNVSFFQRYGSNLFGLTGTLGSEETINLLNTTYTVDSFIIPPFKQMQHQELSPIIVTNEQEWYTNIIESTLQKLYHDRGVLIIARYINQVNYIHKILISKYDPKKIKVYKTQRDSDVVHAELKAGEVIIATNIAGRGTDIKPSSRIESNGGLHVIMTFLPENKRIEAQNVGRTSRTGNKGSSQFILFDTSIRTLKKLRNLRDIQETESLAKAETEITRVCSKDAIFHEFCDLLNNFEEDDIRTVEDRFGIWLQTNNAVFDIESKDTLLTQFTESFKSKIMLDKESNKLIQNICFYMKKAITFVKSQKYEEAIDEYSKAIEMDPQFAENAYYNRAYCRLAGYGGDLFKSWDTLSVTVNELFQSKSRSWNRNQIEKAREDLKAARKIINYRLLELQIIQRASDGPSLSEQVKNKLTLYTVQLGAIKQAIGIDQDETEEEMDDLKKNREKLQKLMKNREDIKELEDIISQLTQINERIQELEVEKNEDIGGVIGKALCNNSEIRIEMIDLEKTLPPDQDIQYYTEEIHEFKNNGMMGNFTISEIAAISWKQVSVMACIGLTQLVAGAFLHIFTLGLGTTVGMALMFEGVHDLITAVKEGIINRNINWKSWAISKGVSLVLSTVMCGTSTFMDTVRTVQAGSDLVAKEMVFGAKKGLALVIKNMSFQLAKGVAKEMTTVLVNEGIEQTMIKQIEEYLVNRLQPKIYEFLKLSSSAQKLLAIDVHNRNRFFQNLIREHALSMLKPESQNEGLGFKGLGKTLGTSVSNSKFRGATAALQIKTAFDEIAELTKFEEKFNKNLNKSINQIMMQHETLIEESESEMARANANSGQQQMGATITRNIQSPDDNNALDDDINLDKVHQQQEHALVKQGKILFNDICTSLSEQLANKMTNIIRDKIVRPITASAVAFSIDQVTAGVEQILSSETSVYKDQLIISEKDHATSKKELTGGTNQTINKEGVELTHDHGTQTKGQVTEFIEQGYYKASQMVVESSADSILFSDFDFSALIQYAQNFKNGENDLSDLLETLDSIFKPNDED